MQRCDACDFLQTTRVLATDQLGELYSHGYDGPRQRQGQKVNAEINMEAMRRLGLAGMKGKTLLDIGCGYGFFLQRMRDRAGMNVAGVELSDAQLRFGAQELDLIMRRDPEALPEKFHGEVDLMVCFEVIEHIVDPIGLIRSYAERLRPGASS